MKTIWTYVFFLVLISGCVPTGERTTVVYESKQTNSLDRAKSLEAFRETVYPIVRTKNCVGCHSSTQVVGFANPDIETAHNELIEKKKVDLMNPAASKIVKQLTYQHNCWSSNCVADSIVVLNAVKEWARITSLPGKAMPTSGVQPIPSVKPTPGAGTVERTKSIQAFSQTLYPLVRGQTCVNCHNSSTHGQAPVFADGNPEVAHDALTFSMKVDLLQPNLSRVVLKLLESHNCWSGNCVADSNLVLEKIREWARLAPPPAVTGGTITSDSKAIPITETLAQTEHGTIILQAEQTDWSNEVVSGRFSEEQDSSASGGKYLHFSPIDPNPKKANRELLIDAARFSSCREFNDVTDLNTSPSRAIKIIQDRVHNPSELIKSGVNIVNDGHLPRIASFQFKIVRPDKRLEYANSLMARSFSGVNTFLLSNGYPVSVTRVTGAKLGNLSGLPTSVATSIHALPKFVPHRLVFNDAGNFLPGKELHNVFSTTFSESPLSIKDNLKSPDHVDLKKFSFYKALKDETSKIMSAKTYHYAQFLNNDVGAMMSRDVKVSLQCPPGILNCTPDQLKFTVEDSGPVLTQSNALDCYTVSANQFQQVAAELCTPENTQNFHLIDVFIHVDIGDPLIAVRKETISYISTSPSTHVEVETYKASGKKIFLNDVARTEEDPNFLYVPPSSNLSPGDIIKNFSTSTYSTLRSSHCISCHGSTNPVAGVPQFASSSDTNSYQAIRPYINFTEPSKSFRFTRTGSLAHNCTAGSATNCGAITTELINSITTWKAANDQDALTLGAQEYRSLSRSERLPGRVKYKFKVTEAGKYNVWARFKNVSVGMNPTSRINFRILNGQNGVLYSVGSAAGTTNSEPCYPWSVTTSPDTWEWTTPGRQNELASIDQRGYVLLNNQFQPLVLPDNRIYFNLDVGEYTLDMIGLTENMKIDAVALNKVSNPTNPNSRLEFQPDRRAADGKHVADFKRKVLRYDLSSRLNLSAGKSAFFEIEVKKEFNDQNYVFRNPRFITSPRDVNLKVQGIKVLINGIWNFPDATYNNIDLVVGDGRVITYAPLISLASTPDDSISFQFDTLSVSNLPLSDLYPKGAPPAIIQDRRCAHLDYFVKNVKPILKNVKVMLTSDMNAYLQNFPGSPQNNARGPRAYNCITCHGPNHPFFKMSTFSNDEEFCREAISRVDFENFYQSLIVRGINGTGNHPKFVFVEKFFKDPSDGNFRGHNRGNDYSLDLQVADGGFAANIVPGAMMIWTYQEILNHPGFAVLSPAQKTTALSRAGMPKKIRKLTVPVEGPNSVLNFPWFVPEVHNAFIYKDGNTAELNNILSAFDVILSTGGNLVARTVGPLVYEVMGFEDNGLPAISNLVDQQGQIPLAGSTKVYVANATPAFDNSTIDYDSTTPAKDSAQVMMERWEFLRDYYREVVIDWVRRENASAPQ